MSAVPRRLIAFVGPTISRDEAERVCPGLDLRPPARRDDLYRERENGAWGFLIIDGVFMQEDAVSPREVVDVLDDGALVLGASSMGALRAADCWPAGARGIGLIYRLYRRGILESDEDVAVAVSADGSDAAVSVPLVNVRSAVSRAVRRRLIDRATARQIVDAAAAIYYPQRTWREVWRRVGPLPPDVTDFCAALDLKREDALRALVYARGMLEDDRLAFIHGRRSDSAFARSETTRERGYDATGGVEPDVLPGRLLDWLIGSGRLTRYRPVSSWPATPTPADLDALARATWEQLREANQLDAELMRLQAVERAAFTADAAGLAPRSHDVRVAQAGIAKRHAARSWERLLRSPHGRLYASQISSAQERLARAKRIREAWFTPSVSAREHEPDGQAMGGLQNLFSLLARRLKRL
jgi:hypothetical protein